LLQHGLRDKCTAYVRERRFDLAARGIYQSGDQAKWHNDALKALSFAHTL